MSNFPSLNFVKLSELTETVRHPTTTLHLELPQGRDRRGGVEYVGLLYPGRSRWESYYSGVVPWLLWVTLFTLNHLDNSRNPTFILLEGRVYLNLLLSA